MQHQTNIRDGAEDLSPREIEARLERDRNDLSATLNALKDKFSPDALWRDGVALVSQNAGSYTHVIDRAIRSNPVGVAVTAVGMAWLLLERYGKGHTDTSAPLAGTKYEAVTRWEDEGGPVSEPPDQIPASNDDWIDEADRLRSRAGRMLDQINAAARKGLTPAADLARSRADVMAALTKDVRRAMSRGLGGVTGTALDSAMAARERVYEVHLSTGAAAADRIRRTPLQAGVVLAAVGAAVAALIPQSDKERELLSAPRDKLLTEARRVMSEERARLSTTVERAARSLVPDPQSWIAPRVGEDRDTTRES